MKPPSHPIRVYLADDHTVVRQGLMALLQAQDDIIIVGDAADGRTAVREIVALAPDVVVMDLGLPQLNGVDATRQICDALPNTGVLILSMHSGEEYVRPALRAGARGYLLKGSGISDFVNAIRAVAQGDAFFSPPIAKLVLQDAQHTSTKVSKESDDQSLTGREREILQLVAEGRSSAEIARTLSLSIKTIEAYRSRIMTKLGVKNIAGLVKHALQIGLVTLDS